MYFAFSASYLLVPRVIWILRFDCHVSTQAIHLTMFYGHCDLRISRAMVVSRIHIVLFDFPLAKHIFMKLVHVVLFKFLNYWSIKIFCRNKMCVHYCKPIFISRFIWDKLVFEDQFSRWRCRLSKQLFSRDI